MINHRPSVAWFLCDMKVLLYLCHICHTLSHIINNIIYIIVFWTSQHDLVSLICHTCELCFHIMSHNLTLWETFVIHYVTQISKTKKNSLSQIWSCHTLCIITLCHTCHTNMPLWSHQAQDKVSCHTLNIHVTHITLE